MKIWFNGAARTVTGSQYLIEMNGHRMLLECGLFQGKRADTYEENLNFSFEIKTLEAVVISHAHIDHSGNLPNLVKNGYTGPIYATPATCKLAEAMLLDAGHIQEVDIEFVNKKRFRHGEPPVDPLYTVEDAAQAAHYLRPVEYDRKFEPIPGITVHYVEAGHILGSAAVILDVKENGRKFRLWFSGDIGRYNLPLLRDPVLPTDVDYLMMECTYGDKLRPNPYAAKEELGLVVNQTVKRGGKIIIPSFAVGRTQEIVYDLQQMTAAKEIPSIPIFVDSPLASTASKVFQAFTNYFDEQTQTFIRNNRTHKILNFKQLKFVDSVEESKSLNDRHEPMVIISASGMAESGRIRHHLRNNIEDSKNTIVIVSWQSPETLGRRLADRERRVKIFGEWYERRAEIATIGGFSAHADQGMLLEYARSAKSPRLKKIILVHGEPRSALPFQEMLVNDLGISEVDYPEQHEVMDL